MAQTHSAVQWDVCASTYSYNVIILSVLTLFSMRYASGLIARLSNRWASRQRSSPSLIRPFAVPREITTFLEKPLTFSAARTCRLIGPLTILAHSQICQPSQRFSSNRPSIYPLVFCPPGMYSPACTSTHLYLLRYHQLSVCLSLVDQNVMISQNLSTMRSLFLTSSQANAS